MTACTRDKMPYFDMHRRLKGIVESQWAALPDRFPTVITDAFVVMPNHVHGILVLKSEPANIGATLAVALGQEQTVVPKLGTVVGVFKSLCLHKWLEFIGTNRDPVGAMWQRNYYERVVRSDDELNAIRQYIFANPLRWSFDSDNPHGLDDAAYDKKWRWLETWRGGMTVRPSVAMGGSKARPYSARNGQGDNDDRIR